MKTILKIIKTSFKKAEKANRSVSLRSKLLKAIAAKDEAKIADLFANASESMVKKALNPRVDYRTTSYREDPLHFAIRNRLTKSVALFIPYVNNINRQPYSVGTALHAASQHGLKKVVRLLLARKDIDVNAKKFAYDSDQPRKNSTPLQTLREYITRFGDEDNVRTEIIELLMRERRS